MRGARAGTKRRLHGGGEPRRRESAVDPDNNKIQLNNNKKSVSSPSVSSCRERIENMLSHLLGGRGGRGCERGSVKSRSPASKRDGNLEVGAPSSDLLRGTSSAAVACSTATRMVTEVQQTNQPNKQKNRTHHEAEQRRGERRREIAAEKNDDFGARRHSKSSSAHRPLVVRCLALGLLLPRGALDVHL